MTNYYGITHNTAHRRGMPEIEKILQGLEEHGNCDACGKSVRRMFGDLRVRLGSQKARLWPDTIACGDYPAFVVSSNFVDALLEKNVHLVVGGSVQFEPPIENGLVKEDAPPYFWIDGQAHRGAKMDFESSGFVDVRFCETCGTRSENVVATYRKRRTTPPLPFVFDCDENKKLDLFTSDLSDTHFFCSEKVLQIVQANNLCNFRITPIEQGVLGESVI